MKPGGNGAPELADRGDQNGPYDSFQAGSVARQEPKVHTPEINPAITRALAEVKNLSGLLRYASKASSSEQKHGLLIELVRLVNGLSVMCSQAGWEVLTAFTLALAKLLSHCAKNSANLNVSTLRTAATAVDFLGNTLSAGPERADIEKAPIRVLIVEDDEVCRRGMMLALSKGDLSVSSEPDAERALENLKVNNYDIIFSDIMMPGVNGFGLLKLLRDLPNHIVTPVVFVTALSDFETKSRSVMSGSDLVAKPIIPAEIVLKAFTYALKERLPGTNDGRKSQLRAVVGVISFDEHGIVQSASTEGAIMLGYSPDELVGFHVDRLFPKQLQVPGLDSGIPCTPSRNSAAAGPLKMVGCRKNSALVQFLITVKCEMFDGKKCNLIFFRCLNPQDAPQIDSEHMGAASHVQPTQRDLMQRLDAMRCQIRLQMEARCLEERALLDRIKALERELTDCKARESSLQEAITSQQKLMLALDQRKKSNSENEGH